MLMEHCSLCSLLDPRYVNKSIEKQRSTVQLQQRKQEDTAKGICFPISQEELKPSIPLRNILEYVKILQWKPCLTQEGSPSHSWSFNLTQNPDWNLKGSNKQTKNVPRSLLLPAYPNLPTLTLSFRLINSSLCTQGVISICLLSSQTHFQSLMTFRFPLDTKVFIVVLPIFSVKSSLLRCKPQEF